jgi:hypothetical protein
MESVFIYFCILLQYVENISAVTGNHYSKFHKHCLSGLIIHSHYTNHQHHLRSVQYCILLYRTVHQTAPLTEPSFTQTQTIKFPYFQLAHSSRRLQRLNATNYSLLLPLAILSPRQESHETTTCTVPPPVVYSHWSCDCWRIVRTLASGELLTFWHESNGAGGEFRNRPGLLLSALCDFFRIASIK